MREILSIFIFIVISVLFFYSKYGSQAKVKETVPVGFCGTVSKSSSTNAPPAIFLAKCATCHILGAGATGPNLFGIQLRQPYPGWFRDFITNQDSLIEQGGPYIKEVMEYSVVEYIHNYKELDSSNINSLLIYFKN
jgi:hypothetical protein